MADELLSFYLCEPQLSLMVEAWLSLTFPTASTEANTILNLTHEPEKAIKILFASSSPRLFFFLIVPCVHRSFLRAGQEAEDARGKGLVAVSRERPATRTPESGAYLSCP